MNLKRSICCLLASVIICLPFASGCSNEKNNKESSQTSDTQASVNTQENSDENSQKNTEENSVSSQSKITPAMWKVEDQNGNFIYMFGTIHAADDDASIMPDYFEAAYNESRAIAVEADVSDIMNDATLTSSLMKYMMYSDGTKIQDHISTETYNAVSKVLKDNFSMYVENAYDYMTPIAWAYALESAVIEKVGLDIKKGIDTVTINRAKNDGKEVLEVESVESQAEMLGRLSENVSEIVLVPYSTQEGFDKQVDSLKKLYGDWKNGNEILEEELDVSSLTDMDEKLKKEIEYYNDEMLGKRNPLMADKAEEYIKAGKKVLVMVGAAHFYGDNGLINLMQKRGYTVTRISPDSTALSSLPAAA